ncbi:MAG: DsbC family protein [Pseudomonadota bacterium]
MIRLSTILIGAALMSGAANGDDTAIRTAFPNTKIDSIDCLTAAPLCEVVAGTSVFYTTQDARLMVIGRVFDLQHGRSLTDDRLDALDAGQPIARSGAVASRPPQSLPQGIAGHFDANDAIVTGEGPRHLAIIADPNCPYCAMVSEAVVELGDVQADIYLVGTVGGRAVPETVYCASDPETALYQAYTKSLDLGASCDAALAVARNERAARALGLSGTPILIRGDGAIRYGALSAPDLDTWLKGGSTQ